jgi:tetratricopeptide (TPR) repeat protein
MSGTPAHDDAIAAALSQNWEEAVKINQAILDLDPKNVDALNRLGFAHLQLGKTKEAKDIYQRVITLDQYNQIAQKNLTKLNNKNHTGGMTAGMVSPLMFLEEPGKTKIVNCVNLAPSKVIAGLRCGQTVRIKVKTHCIEIRDEENVYLGALPDDVSFKLSKYIAGENEYKVIIRSIGKNTLTVFIREISRGKVYAAQPSFIPASTFIASGKVDDGSDKPDTQATGEEEEEE